MRRPPGERATWHLTAHPILILSQVVNAEIVDGFLKDVCANNYAEESVSNTFLQQ